MRVVSHAMRAIHALHPLGAGRRVLEVAGQELHAPVTVQSVPAGGLRWRHAATSIRRVRLAVRCAPSDRPGKRRELQSMTVARSRQVPDTFRCVNDHSRRESSKRLSHSRKLLLST